MLSFIKENVLLKTSPVFIYYEEEDLRNFQNPHIDARFRHHNIALDQIESNKVICSLLSKKMALYRSNIF